MSEIQNKINKLIENRETARMGGGQKACGNADQYHDHHDRSQQKQRPGQLLGQIFRHGNPLRKACSQIPVKQLLHIQYILDRNRLVQPVSLNQSLLGFLRHLRADHQRHRIGGHGPDDKKHQCNGYKYGKNAPSKTAQQKT